MSLSHPHPLFTYLGSNTYETREATVQATMLSGKYQTEKVCRFWSKNRRGLCLSPSCNDLCIVEDIEHILVRCLSLDKTRVNLMRFTSQYASSQPLHIRYLVHQCCAPSNYLFIQFLLDCSVIPDVISAKQNYGPEVLNPIFYITRTWCYALHRERLKILGRWKNFNK